MGHDFTVSYQGGELQREVGSFSAGRWLGFPEAVYDALESREMNDGCSGNGRTKEFSRVQIEQALKRLQELRWKYSEGGRWLSLYNAVAYLETCLKEMPAGGKVIIKFW